MAQIFSCDSVWLRFKFAAGLDFRTAARFKASVWHYNVRYRIMPSSIDTRNAHVIQFLIDKVFGKAILFSIWKQSAQRAHSETLFFDRADQKESALENFTAIAAKRMSPLCQESSFWCHLGHQLSILSVFAQEESIYFQQRLSYTPNPLVHTRFFLQHGQGKLQ